MCVALCLWMGVFISVCYLFHSIQTSLSQHLAGVWVSVWSYYIMSMLDYRAYLILINYSDSSRCMHNAWIFDHDFLKKLLCCSATSLGLSHWPQIYTFFHKNQIFSVEARCSKNFRRHEAEMFLICSNRVPMIVLTKKTRVSQCSYLSIEKLYLFVFQLKICYDELFPDSLV